VKGLKSRLDKSGPRVGGGRVLQRVTPASHADNYGGNQATLRQFALDDRKTIEVARGGLTGPSGQLPYLDRIQASFGAHDLSSIRAFRGVAARNASRSLGAAAFTHGERVAFRGTPSLRTVAHEAAHVVQQRARAAGSRASLEQEADGVADAVARNRSAESLLDHHERRAPQPAPIVQLEEAPAAARADGAQTAEGQALAEAPIPTATIILVGSPGNPAIGFDALSPYNFSNAAIRAIPGLRAAIPGTEVTVLFFTPGYKLRGQQVYQTAKQQLQATQATVVEVKTAAEVISVLNTGLVTSNDGVPTRAIKVARFLYFGHGNSDAFLLNFSWGVHTHRLKKSQVNAIRANAFAPAGDAYLFTCHVAEGPDSFMSLWVSHLGVTAVGAKGTTAFNYRYKAKHLERAVNSQLPKWFLGLPYMNVMKRLGPDPQ
jgi:uncharacterized protein DUF4157